MPTTDLEENKIKQAQPEEGNDTAQNEREIRKNIFKNERVNFILGVILVIFSLYLTISFISFFFSVGSPTANPPMALPSAPKSATCFAASIRKSG